MSTRARTIPSLCGPWSRICTSAAPQIALGGGEEKIARQHEQREADRARAPGAADRRGHLRRAGDPRPAALLPARDGRQGGAGRRRDHRLRQGRRAPGGGLRLRLHGHGRLDGDDRRAEGHAPARARPDQADPLHLAARLRRRAHPGGRRLAVRRLRAPVPRGGRDERGDPPDRRPDGPLRGRHRLHPRPGRLRADGQGPRLDGARRARTSCALPSARMSPRRSSAARGCTAASRASGTWRSPTTRSASSGSSSTSPTCPRTARRRRRSRPGDSDPVERAEEELLDILPESNRKPYDMYEVIRRIIDDGEYFDMKGQWAKTIITCFARFGGRPAGIVANQPSSSAASSTTTRPTRPPAS